MMIIQILPRAVRGTGAATQVCGGSGDWWPGGWISSRANLGAISAPDV